jgi:hypothetical protein
MRFLRRFVTRGAAPQGDAGMWQPNGQVLYDRGREIAGDAAVRAHAYRVTFTLAKAPGARLLVWVYAVHANPEISPGPYALGYRGECWIGKPGSDDDEMAAAWNDDDADSYATPAYADMAACDFAWILARTPRTAADDPGGELGFFEWDGQMAPAGTDD